MGKNTFKRPPWVDDDPFDAYIPSEMTEKAARLALTRATEPIPRYMNEELLSMTESYIISKLKKVWIDSPESMLMTYDEAVDDLVKDKSPGFPYYYKWSTKGAALAGDLGIPVKVKQMLAGEDVPTYFTITGKLELRAREKVEAGKTRMFFASDLHHLITSKILYEKQNQQLMESIDKIPIQIGIQLPGPVFTKKILSKGPIAVEHDIVGCDLRFILRIARMIRNIRHHFLPERYRLCGQHLYNTVYCGLSAGLGGMYRVYGNKSGWLNTSNDNSFEQWICLIVSCFANYPGVDPESIFDSLIFSDDGLTKMLKGEFSILSDWLLSYNFEFETPGPQDIFRCAFLSHRVEWRFIEGFGDFLVSAGNLPKLLSSLHWVKKSPTLTFEESCVAHLIGVRICLFPWAVYFEEADEILSSYLKKVTITDFIASILPARLTERQLFALHTRFEFVFSSDQVEALKLLKTSGLKFKAGLKEFSVVHDENEISEGEG